MTDEGMVVLRVGQGRCAGRSAMAMAEGRRMGKEKGERKESRAEVRGEKLMGLIEGKAGKEAGRAELSQVEGEGWVGEGTAQRGGWHHVNVNYGFVFKFSNFQILF